MSLAPTRTEPPPLRALPVPLTAPRAALTVIREEPAPPVAPTQGMLALALAAPAPLGPGLVDAEPDEFAARRPTPGHLLPDPRSWAAQFVQAAVEVAAGRRPVAQLVRWAGDDVRALLARRSALATRRPPCRHGRGASATARRTVVQSARVFLPRDGAAEACVVVRDGARVRAVALRMEGLDGRWRVTALEIG